MSEKTTGVEPGPGTEPPHRARGKSRLRPHVNPALSLTRKVLITAVGSVVLVAGFIMLVTPGPAFLLIPLGLAILATEWDWADRWLQKAKDQARRAKEKAEALDPKVRRRRLLLGLAAFVLVAGTVTAYVANYGLPAFAIHGWDWVQSIVGWLPELPGPTADSLNAGRQAM